MIYINDNGTIMQFLNTKESDTYSFVHQYEQKAGGCGGNCDCDCGKDN